MIGDKNLKNKSGIGNSLPILRPHGVESTHILRKSLE
jgi:hypothetical protein